MKILGVIFLILFSLNGCATLSQKDCLQGSWFELGLQDGRQGKLLSRLSQHQKSCAEYGIYVDKKDYYAGRNKGLEDYCQLDNAIDLGLSGYRYQSVCPADIHRDFLRYNRVAYAIYQGQQNLKNIDQRLLYQEKCLLETKLNKDERLKIRLEVRELEIERTARRHELYSRERRLDYLLKRR
jgi:hypothetical protein